MLAERQLVVSLWGLSYVIFIKNKKKKRKKERKKEKEKEKMGRHIDHYQ
jgi:CelD/BcsL family acetyltransferase involved in cellulose biosynthesis